MNITFSRTPGMAVIAANQIDGAPPRVLETKSVEAILLLAILEKLEEIRLGVRDVECEITPFPGP